MTPLWIVPEQWVELNPPAEVRKLGEVRSPENLVAAAAALLVRSAKRYQPTTSLTWCNIFVSDLAAILRAPLPHRFDLGDGKGKREMRANDMALGLRARAFSGWGPVSEFEAQVLAQLGMPVVAAWRNARGPGHIVFVVPRREGDASGTYVTGAGRACVEHCPIQKVFPRLEQVEFYGYTQ